MHCGIAITATALLDAPVEKKAFARWSATSQEGVYRRDADTLVVAVKEVDKDALMWHQKLKSALLLDIHRQLTDAVVSDQHRVNRTPYPGLLGKLTEQRYRAELKVSVGKWSGGARVVNNDIHGNKGRLVLSFKDFSLEGAQARLPKPSWSAYRLEILNEALERQDYDGLEVLWSEQGLELDKLRAASDRVGMQRLVAFPWHRDDPVSMRDAFSRLYLCGHMCAVLPGRHLEIARNLSQLDPAAASVHALSALVTNQEPVMEEALEILGRTLNENRGGKELVSLLRRSATEAIDPNDPLNDGVTRYVIATGGFYWIDSAAPSEPGDEFAVAVEAFEAGHSADSVLNALLVAITKAPRNAAAWSYAASVLTYMQRDLQAIAFFHQALMLDPGLIDARWNLTQLYSSNAASELAYAMATDISDRLSRGERAISTADLENKVTDYLGSRVQLDSQLLGHLHENQR